ncbi:hypothetical protein NC652_027744 [Populus alba x Populus x berolinensis]|nr:hypothetical protein NC652_027744 [Populus alba x Populus x berolinensis]
MSSKRYKLLQLLNPVPAYVEAAAKGKGSGEVVFGDKRFVAVVEKPPWNLDSVHTY